MPHLFVPPAVAHALLEERRVYAADLARACHTDHVCDRWNRELRRLDPLLRMVRAPEMEVVGTPLVPGCYHLIRDNPDAPQSVTPITGPDGGFREPPGSLLEQLQSMDLQNPSVRRMRARVQQKLDEQQDRRREEIRGERQRDLLERWRAVSRTQVSTNTDTPWSQNVNGRRGAARKAG